MINIDKIGLEQLDELYSLGLISAEMTGKVSSYKINNWKRFLGFIEKIWKKIKSLFVQNIGPNLEDLSIGGLFKAAECKKPSEVINTIISELGLPFPKDEDLPRLFFQWDSEIKKISELFKQTEINDSEGNSSYAKASNEVKVPPFATLIDQVAKRMGVTWQEASTFKWSEVYLALLIDKKNYLFQKDFQKKLQSKYKK